MRSPRTIHQAELFSRVQSCFSFEHLCPAGFDKVGGASGVDEYGIPGPERDVSIDTCVMGFGPLVCIWESQCSGEVLGVVERGGDVISEWLRYFESV